MVRYCAGSTTCAEVFNRAEAAEVSVEAFFGSLGIKISKESKEKAFTDDKATFTHGDKEYPILTLKGSPAPHEDLFQSYIMEQLATVSMQRPHVTIADTHRNPFLDGRKPDITHFAEGVQSSLYVVMLGEVKVYTEKFSASHRGELLTFLKRVLLAQPLRQRVVGYLIDGFHVSFMSLSKGVDKDTRSPLKSRELVSEQTVQYTPDCVLAENSLGLRALVALLRAAPEAVGFAKPQNIPQDVKPLAYIGKGATCYVYAVEGDDVVKVCARSEHAKHEYDTLQLLQRYGAGQGVPEVRYNIKYPHALVMPRLFPFSASEARPTTAQWNELLRVLQIAHEKCNICHCDIRVGNWMRLGTQSKLIDWGFSRPASQAAPYSGTLSYASTSVLKQFIKDRNEVTVKPEDDLESVVRVAHRLVTGRSYLAASNDTDDTTAQKSSAFWHAVAKQEPWLTYVRAARNKDYRLAGLPLLFAIDDMAQPDFSSK